MSSIKSNLTKLLFSIPIISFKGLLIILLAYDSRQTFKQIILFTYSSYLYSIAQRWAESPSLLTGQEISQYLDVLLW